MVKQLYTQFIKTSCKFYSLNRARVYKYPSITPSCMVTLLLIAFFVKDEVIPFPTLMWNFSNIPECWYIGKKWKKISCRSSILKPNNFKGIFHLCADLGEFLAYSSDTRRKFQLFLFAAIQYFFKNCRNSEFIFFSL